MNNRVLEQAVSSRAKKKPCWSQRLVPSHPQGRARWTLSCWQGRWPALNMVEIEIGVLRSQCLDRRIATQERLVSEIAAWERQRNASGARIKWMFTTEKARTKLGRA